MYLREQGIGDSSKRQSPWARGVPFLLQYGRGRSQCGLLLLVVDDAMRALCTSGVCGPSCVCPALREGLAQPIERCLEGLSRCSRDLRGVDGLGRQGRS